MAYNIYHVILLILIIVIVLCVIDSSPITTIIGVCAGASFGAMFMTSDNIDKLPSKGDINENDIKFIPDSPAEYPGAIDKPNEERFSDPSTNFNTPLHGDEAGAMQGLSRNDPLRPTIGSMDRYRKVAPFIREEMESNETREWYGISEN